MEEFSELLAELEGYEESEELEDETIRTKAKWAEKYPRIFPNVPVPIAQLTLHDITNHQRVNEHNRDTISESQSSKGTRWEFSSSLSFYRDNGFTIMEFQNQY